MHNKLGIIHGRGGYVAWNGVPHPALRAGGVDRGRPAAPDCPGYRIHSEMQEFEFKKFLYVRLFARVISHGF